MYDSKTDLLPIVAQYHSVMFTHLCQQNQLRFVKAVIHRTAVEGYPILTKSLLRDTTNDTVKEQFQQLRLLA